MIIKRRLTLVVIAIAFAAMAAKKTPTAPGKYQEWGPDIDSVEIVKTFKFTDYSKVVVQPLDTSSTPKAEEADMVEKVANVAAHATEPFLAGVRKGVPDAVLASASSASRSLIVRGKITALDPGSRAKRMWVGYGAGAARTAIDGEIVDAKSGEVLVRFTQVRRSGIERFGRGSSYEEIMKRNLTAIGEDVANLLKEF
ncbi:MAG: hypothetical protein QOE82_3476 [Thermoanaerobaculia bacterium]|jgi:hypothetical protein|nr:hypothetical protein [Thermoanaerobaculia bacterium]